MSMKLADQRVTAEEMAAAINSLEASKDSTAAALQGTVQIGAVIEELRLDATPAQIWHHIQNQRNVAETKRRDAESEKQLSEDDWRRRKSSIIATIISTVVILISSWCGYMSQVDNDATTPTSSAAPAQNNPASTSERAEITVSGNSGTEVIDANGDVTVSGNYDTLTIHGHCSTLTVTGEENTINLDNVDILDIGGSYNSVFWADDNHPSVDNSGSGNTLRPSASP